MAGGFTVFRWKSGKWQHISHELGADGHHKVDTHTAQEFGGRSGGVEDDWLLRRDATNTYTQIANTEIPSNGTLWLFTNGSWQSLYKRSSGSSSAPAVIAGIAKEGDIVIDMRGAGRGGDDIGNGDFKFVLPSGELEDVEVEHTLVQDDAALPMVQIPDLEEVEDDDAREAAAAPDMAVVEQAARIAARLKEIMQEPGMMADWAAIEKGDKAPDKIAKVVLKLYEEATPSPTPGTTAVFDLTAMANDFDRAAKGGAEEGFSSAETGFLSAEAATVCSYTSNLLAGLGSTVDYFNQLKTIRDAIDRTGTVTGERQADGVANTAAMSGMMDAPKIVSGLFVAVNIVVDAAAKGASASSGLTAYAAASSAVASGIPFVGTALSLVTCVRVIRKGARAESRRRELVKMLNAGQLGEEMTELVSFCVHKTKRKVRLAAATAGTAVAGGASTGILAGTAITGAVNAWNPVGWTLLAVAAVGGCGVVGYKVYRRATRKKRHEKRAQKGHGLSPTNATDMARRLLVIARNTGHPDNRAALGMLGLFKVAAEDINKPGVGEEVEKMINRHLQHV